MQNPGIEFVFVCISREQWLAWWQDWLWLSGSALAALFPVWKHLEHPSLTPRSFMTQATQLPSWLLSSPLLQQNPGKSVEAHGYNVSLSLFVVLLSMWLFFFFLICVLTRGVIIIKLHSEFKGSKQLLNLTISQNKILLTC